MSLNQGAVSVFEANSGAHQKRRPCGANSRKNADLAVVLVVGWVALERRSESGWCEHS